jgi:predicted HicB family RNase H-like nuclease
MQLHYKGFKIKTGFSAKAGAFYGEVLNSDALLSWQAADLLSLEMAMHDAIDRYLDWRALEPSLHPVDVLSAAEITTTL